MLKMLSTQVGGLLSKIASDKEDAIEETARLLAQAGAFEGTVYFACFDELQAIEINALNATEPFRKLRPWTSSVEISDLDRVCIFTHSANHPDALALAHRLYDSFIPFAVVANEKEEDAGEMGDLAYTYISMGIKKGLLPNELGERIVMPHTLTALFIYEAIKIAYDEMLGGL
ncbi:MULTISPECIES: DUF2529 family protein [unclassified Rummeliibacillus]|uniref:DUF2529 family protein n=1 Tax=unclassified Rummeliibacillus TaxID=2622809 RepID=UPI000E66EEA0|nr:MULTISPECIES: DUF2529 family protein [unclassified Rummeliibacillus]RIJ69482.1 DUF2529 family protein [Rummeliibacillus sp. POC4]RPJ96448.1 DUF2529 family protein [Rummeliibacillus sp. TYF005]